MAWLVKVPEGRKRAPGCAILPPEVLPCTPRLTRKTEETAGLTRIYPWTAFSPSFGRFSPPLQLRDQSPRPEGKPIYFKPQTSINRDDTTSPPERSRQSPYRHLEERKEGGGKLRQPAPRRPAPRSPRPPSPPRSPEGSAAGRRLPRQRGGGAGRRSAFPARAHLGRRGGLSPAEQGGDRRSRRRPAAPSRARRCQPSPRAAARRWVAGRCPARLLSHSALSHSLSLFLRAGEPGSNIRAAPPPPRGAQELTSPAPGV